MFPFVVCETQFSNVQKNAADTMSLARGESLEVIARNE